MTRAHLATFPPRRALMLDVVARMAPQVDHLVVVLNEYDAVPEDLGGYTNVEPIIPPRDLKDAGKFLPQPGHSEPVFLIDDDIAYPPDYVETTLARIGNRDVERNVYAYQGNAWMKENGQVTVRNFMFKKAHDRVTGAGLIGTGTLCAIGKNLPGLDVMESAAGFVDVRYCHWLAMRSVSPWVLPREDKWLRPTLPKELKASSLFHTVHKAQPELYTGELRKFLPLWRHMGQEYAAR